MGPVTRSHILLAFGGLTPSKGQVRVRVSSDVAKALCVRRIALDAKLQVDLLSHLPIEVVEDILVELFHGWALATRVLRVNTYLMEVGLSVRDSIGVAWWSGSLPPFRPVLPLADEEVVVNVVAQYHLMCRGGSSEDIERLLREDVWLNNFTICLVLAAYVPAEALVGFVPREREHRPLFRPATIVLAPVLMDTLAWVSPGMPHGRSLWAMPSTLLAIEQAHHILMPLNLDNHHWVALHASKRLVEVFALLQSDNESARIRTHTKVVISYLKACNFFLLDSPPLHVHSHRHWKQRDCSSCGLFTLNILLSLFQGRRVQVDMSCPMSWRKHFALKIMQEAPSL